MSSAKPVTQVGKRRERFYRRGLADSQGAWTGRFHEQDTIFCVMERCEVGVRQGAELSEKGFSNRRKPFRTGELAP